MELTVEPRVPDRHIEELRTRGYSLVEGYLTPEEVELGRAAFHASHPTWEDFVADPERWRAKHPQKELPFRGSYLNRLSVHPRFIDLARRAIGTDDIFLTQSISWAKYAGMVDSDQHLHRDYGNNTLVVPKEHDPHFLQIASITYFTDVTLDLGPTYVVSNEDAVGQPTWPTNLTKADHPDLYEHEVPIVVPAGTLLLYTTNTFHRGSRFLADEGLRLSLHLVWRAAGHEWMGWRAWPREAWRPWMAELLEWCTVDQRNVLGFPKPGDPYWDAQTLEQVQARYPGMDLEPYREALPT